MANFPPPLRVFLDAGCDLTAPGLPLDAVCQVVADMRTMSPEDRAAQARVATACLDVLLGLQEWPGPVPQQTLATGWAWEVELLENPELAGKVVAALPAHMVDGMRGPT